MNDYETFLQTHHRQPTYTELKEMLRLAEEQDRLRRKEQQDQEKWEQLQEKMWWPGDPKEFEEPEPVVKDCRHLRESGQYCGSVAVKGRDFCAYHLRDRGRRLKMARARARHQRWRLQLPPLEDLYAVQVSIDRVLNALLDEQLDRHTGGLVLYGLQQAATNLSRPAEVWEDSCRFQSREQLELPGFEAEFDLPEDFDLDAPPEVAFPETESGTSQAAAAAEEKAAAGNEAGESAAGKKEGASPDATGASPLTAAVLDRVGAGAVSRKGPRAAEAAPTSAADADRVGKGRSAAGSVLAKSK